MDRHPIRPHIDPRRGKDDAGPGVDPTLFREALSHWASTVTVVAVRDGADVHATTVTSLMPLSADPPLVAVGLGAGAQVLPWMDVGARFAVSVLTERHRRVASMLTDSFPVGPSPFPGDGDPVVEGAVVGLVCSVRDVHPTEGGVRLVIGLVEGVREGSGDRPLLYHRRGYRALPDPEG